jgi:hypothetical protein
MQNSQMNAVDDGIRPPVPILCRPQAMAIPGGAGQDRAAAGEQSQLKLALFGNEVTVQMFGPDLTPWRPFLKWSRIWVTRKRSREGSSHTVIGSTKEPVENWQYRTLPGPLPSMRASVGYANPV